MPVALPVAILGAAAIGAGASALASSSASKAATNAANLNNQTQLQIYGQNKATLSPFVNSGTQAQGSINALLGLGGDAQGASNAFNQFQNSDGYQFRVDQGMKALNTGLASNGLIQSGAAIKAAQAYGQGQASDEFGKYMGYLGNQQQTGLSAANALAGVGTNYANATGANNNSAASAQGNAALSAGANVNSLLGTSLSSLALKQGLGSSYGGSGGSGGFQPQNFGYQSPGVGAIGSY